MEEQIEFSEFFSVMNISGIIIIEDKLEYDMKRTAFIYDYLLMENVDRESFLTQIPDKDTVALLTNIFSVYLDNKSKIIWENIPERDMEYYITDIGLEALMEQVELLSVEKFMALESPIKRYGLVLKYNTSAGYKGILKGAKLCGRNYPLRTYNDFSAYDLSCINDDIKEFARENHYFLCVIDNFIGHEPRGKEIVDELVQNANVREKGICISLSSQDEDIERSLDEIHIGFVKKDDPDLENKIKRHLILSQYKIVLALLLQKRNKAIERAFKYAKDNIDVAIYLSAMAKEEGITNHEALNQWIDLRENYFAYQDGKEEIKRTIILSSLLERIGDRDFLKGREAQDTTEFQRFEQYDYCVNDFLSPPMSGDIFYIKEKYYMLIGQECDLSLREGCRKNPIAELVPVSLVKSIDMGKFKENYNFEKLLLGKFKTVDGQICNISIDCTRREVIDNEILDMCSYNEDGKAKLILDSELDDKAKYMLPIHWQEYYGSIKRRISNLHSKYQSIESKKDELGFNVCELIEDLGASHNNRLLSIIDFQSIDNTINYAVKRVCRVRNHTLLINKLFLEYRGRQAFNTINMDVGRTSQYTFVIENQEYRKVGNTALIILTTSRKDNEGSKLKNRTWIISKEEFINNIRIGYEDEYSKYEAAFNGLDEMIMLEGIKGNMINGVVQYTKQVKSEELILKIKLI